MKLYTYFRSSAAYRVRIALNIKAIDYQNVSIHLRRDGGEHLLPMYRVANPQRLVPALDHDGDVIPQSLAILEYLDEMFPQPSLLPRKCSDRAFVRSMALAVACDMHPLNNLRVLEYLRLSLGQSEDSIARWYQHWIAEGFQGLEEQARRLTADGRYCFGSQLTLADVCLVPQVYNARRFECDLSHFPTLCKISANLERLDVFDRASPERQPDAE